MSSKHYDVKSFTAAGSIGYLLKMSHSLVHDAAAAGFVGHDLSFIQWLVLIKLRERAGLTPSELCRAMRHDNGALTRVLDQLEERGLLSRERSQRDRRAVELNLTPAGRRKVTELVPLVVELLNEVLADFSKAEFAELVRLLEKLVARLQEREAADAVVIAP